MTRDDETAGPVVLFDGVCNLCDQSVQFLLEHERDDALRFASLQSPFAARVLTKLGRPLETGDPSSVLLVVDGLVFSHSDAALRIAAHLRAPYRWLRVGWIVPRFLRDLVYRFVARHRYRWFGKMESCLVPLPRWKGRFLEA